MKEATKLTFSGRTECKVASRSSFLRARLDEGEGGAILPHVAPGETCHTKLIKVQ